MSGATSIQANRLTRVWTLSLAELLPTSQELTAICTKLASPEQHLF